MPTIFTTSFLETCLHTIKPGPHTMENPYGSAPLFEWFHVHLQVGHWASMKESRCWADWFNRGRGLCPTEQV